MQANDTRMPRADSVVRAYAIRRINPFLGVLQVIQSDEGRAISANGVVWDIEVRAPQSGAWGSLNKHNAEMAWYRYGLWSEKDGLVHRPLAPHLDSDPLTQRCNALIRHIELHLTQLPFSLADTGELWLFDHDDSKALALLAARIPDQPPPSPEPKYWSASIGADGVPSQRRFPAAGKLEKLVRERAGFNIKKHWVTRHTDGSASVEATGQHVPAEHFPVYLLSEDWPEAEQRALVREFIEWTAPSLLTLQTLGTRERGRLENSLNIQAESVEHHWHLYPEIITENCIRAARVQCRLQEANRAGGNG